MELFTTMTHYRKMMEFSDCSADGSGHPTGNHRMMGAQIPHVTKGEEQTAASTGTG